MSERCACGGVPYVSERMDAMRAKIEAERIDRGLPPSAPRKPRCASCMWANIQQALDPKNDINSPGGSA